MRSSFGEYAAALRQRLNIGQSEFARKIGESVARVSNLEHHRTHISEDVIQKYGAALCGSAEELEKLRRYAEYSNIHQKGEEDDIAKIFALLKGGGAGLTKDVKRTILAILQSELGENVELLKLNTANPTRTARNSRFPKRPVLDDKRFAELCILAEEVRARHGARDARVDILRLIECESLESQRIDLDVLEKLPDFVGRAFACILGHAEGHTILIEESVFKLVSNGRGSSWVRHVLAHELSHHFLHAELLVSERTCYLPPQVAAEIDPCNIPAGIDEAENWRRIDSLIEEEAECFATMLLVPWTVFLRRKDYSSMASDFGADHGNVKRYGQYLQQNAVRDRIRSHLWHVGQRDHLIFKV